MKNKKQNSKKQSNSNKQEGIAVDNCIVEEELGYGKFRVSLPNGAKAICHVTGKMKMNMKKIRVVPMDRVLVELSPYNLEQGIIKYRNK